MSIKALWSFRLETVFFFYPSLCCGHHINVVRCNTFSPKNMMCLKRPWFLSVRHFMMPPNFPPFPFLLLFFSFDLGKVPKQKALVIKFISQGCNFKAAWTLVQGFGEERWATNEIPEKLSLYKNVISLNSLTTQSLNMKEKSFEALLRDIETLIYI